MSEPDEKGYTYYLCPCGAFLCRPPDRDSMRGYEPDTPCQFCGRELSNQVTKDESKKAFLWRVEEIRNSEG